MALKLIRMSDKCLFEFLNAVMPVIITPPEIPSLIEIK